jgi:hypothetical protein
VKELLLKRAYLEGAPMDISILEKQLTLMSDFEKRYSGTPEHPRRYSHIEEELTFSQNKEPDIVPVDYFFKPDIVGNLFTHRQVRCPKIFLQFLSY